MSDMEVHIAEINASLKEIRKLTEKHDRTLYGQDGGNGIASDIARHNALEKKVNQVLLWIGGLIAANIGSLLKGVVPVINP